MVLVITVLKVSFFINIIIYSSGIGDKHVPWVLDMKDMDVTVGIDDEMVIRAMHLFNFPAGKAYLKEKGVPEEVIAKLDLLGISSIANLMG